MTDTQTTKFSKTSEKTGIKSSASNDQVITSPIPGNQAIPDSLLRRHEFLIINSPLNIKKEEGFINNIPQSFEKSYLKGLLEKRKGNYATSFERLYEQLKGSPMYLNYYDELVYQAEINGKIPLVDDDIKKGRYSSNKRLPYLQGLVFASKGEYKKALKEFEVLIQDIPNDPAIYLQLSNIYRNLGDYNKALSILERLLKLSEKKWYSDRDILRIKISNLAGALFYLSGKYEEAEQAFTDELKLALRLNARRYEAKALVNLGILLDEEGMLDSARNYYQKAVSSSDEINDLETKAFAFSELGVSYSFTNNPIQSRDFYLKSFELYNKLGNRVRLSFLSNNIGKIYLNMFNYYSALNSFQKGIEFAGGNKRAQVLNLIGVADVYANLSNYTKALEYYEKARQLSSEIKDVTLLTDVNIGLGTLSFNLNLTNNAIKYFHAADELCQTAGNPFMSASIFNKCGVVYFQADSLESAEKYFNKAILLSRQYADSYTEASSILELAGIFVAKNQADKASQILNSMNFSSSIRDYDYLKAQKEILLGKISIQKNDFKSAQRHFNHAIALGRKLGDEDMQIEANFETARLYEKQNLFTNAENHYKASSSLIEKVSRSLNSNQEVQIAYFSSKNDVYKAFANFYLDRNKFKKAFEIIESSRSRNTIQNLNNLMIQSLLNEKESLDKLYDYEWLLSSGYLNHTSLDSIRREYDLFKAKLVNKEPRLKDYIFTGSNPHLHDIQKALAGDEYILSIFSNNESTMLFLISKNDFKPVQINIGNDELLRLVRNISPYFNSGGLKSKTYFNQDLFSFNSKASFELFQKIIKPAVKFIPMNSKLIISSSTELSILPFEFLVTEFNQNESSYNYKDKEYFIFRYNISYTPSATTYLKLKSNSLFNTGQKLLIGDPSIDYTSNSFAERRGLLQEDNPGMPRNIMLLPLKYSSEEIKQINSVIDADKILLSKEATKENFKEFSKLSSIIHLSTHSFLYNEQPFIFFSNTNPKSSESFLEASEIAQLKLNSDLVVLSSCNSGLGLVDEAEGTIGMTKAFYEAGAKTLVVSLWDVNDNYTSKFMSLFYQKLGEGFNKSEALRQAKIEFIRKYSANPYFWAAFVLSGDTSTLNLTSQAGISYIYIIILLLVLVIISVFIYRRKHIHLS